MMVAALLVGGTGVAVLGSVKVPLAKRLLIDEARVGGLVSIFGFVLIPVILTAGFVTDHIGRQAVFMTGSVLFAASLGLLAAARKYVVALTAVLLLGAAWAMLINVSNVLTPLAFAGDPPNVARATNLANVFFGLGAFLTPLAVAFLVARRSLRMALGLLALLSLVPAVLALGVDFRALAPESPEQSHSAEAPGFGSLLGDPVLWLCGLAMFFYAPLESSLGAWTTTYLGERGVSDRAAPRLLSGFWLAYMASRLTAAFLLPGGRETTTLVMVAAASFAVLVAIVVSRGAVAAGALVLAAGVVFGPIFPIIMALLLGHFPATLHGRAVGLLFALAGIGWTVIPILIGAYARRAGVQRGFAIAAGSAAGLTGIALLFALR
jgi:fucose permease